MGGQMLNAASQESQNRRSRKWSEKMYEKTKADNISFWNMQNEYNSPQAQMKRFQDAGLNPALMYGGSVSGASGSAGPIASPDLQQPQFRSPEWGNVASGAAFAALNAIADLDIKQANVDNLKTQNTVLQNQALLYETRAQREKFDLDFEQNLMPWSADYRKEKTRQLKTSTDIALNDDMRRALTTSSSLREASERIETMHVQRANMIVDRNARMAEIARIKNITYNEEIQGKILKLDLALREKGINPNDPMYARVLGTAFDSVYNAYKAADPVEKSVIDRLLSLLVFKH